jgi:hypothetical protein
VLRMTEATEVTTLLPSMSRFEIFSPLVASTWFQLNGLPAAVWLSVTWKTLLGRSRLEFVEQEPLPQSLARHRGRPQFALVPTKPYSGTGGSHSPVAMSDKSASKLFPSN